MRDGFSATEVATKFGVSHQSVYAWFARYEAGGLEALSEQSRRPKVSPGQIDGVIEARILELRRHHPGWGQLRIKHQLRREGVEPLPAPSSIYRTLERHGVPDEILTDNGKVFTNRFGPTPAKVLFDRICRDSGIEHRLTAPASPTTAGKVERFHRTLSDEFLTARTFRSIDAAQEELDGRIDHYNTERPLQSLKMATPSDRASVQLERSPRDQRSSLRPSMRTDRERTGSRGRSRSMA